MISFCEQILLMLNVLMMSYLLFNKEFNKHHCVKGIICLLASLVVIVLKNAKFMKNVATRSLNLT